MTNIFDKFCILCLVYYYTVLEDIILHHLSLFLCHCQMKQQELSRVCTMGERLTAANHYASEVFRSHGKELKGSWDSLTQMADDRATLLSLSVTFHDEQQKVNNL